MFAITESVPSLKEIKELCTWDEFSELQKWIVYKIVEEKRTWAHIAKEYTEITGKSLGQSAIRTCLVRTALSQKWEKGQLTGSDPYLCNEDQQLLFVEITERAQITKAFNTITLLDEALRIKTARYQKGSSLLKALRCYTLASDFDSKEHNTPSRAWINGICSKAEAHLATVTYIDRNRFKSCSFDVIDTFFNMFTHVILNTPPELRFTADETMMDKTNGNKVIIPDTMKQYIEPQPPEIPHLTAMCATSVYGMKPPLFVIVSGLKNMPDELKLAVNTGKIWLASTHSGWMTRWTFTLWAFHFVIWFLTCKDVMDKSFANKLGLVVMDGHMSRENPLALEILRDAGILVLILPPHTTHVMQMFDVGLAGALKKRFTQYFNDYTKDEKYYIPQNNTATMRRIAIEAFMHAWDDIANPHNCASAAASVGLEPVDRSRPKTNPYVRNLTQQEQEIFEQNRRRRATMLNINNSLITQNEKIEEIRTTLLRGDRDRDLCRKKSDFPNFYELYKFIKNKAAENGAFMLSDPPPYRGNFFYDR